MENEPPQPKFRRRTLLFVILAIVAAALGAAAGITFAPETSTTATTTSQPKSDKPLVEPTLATEEITGGLSNIWDMVFPDEQTLVFDDRGGSIYGLSLATKERWLITKLSNVRVQGEGGLLGLALDHQFTDNGFAYACYNASGPTRSVRVTRFKLSSDKRSASDFTDIIADIQSQGGRHSGCRLTMDSQNVLWVATGDSAIGKAPQDPKSLGGKVLRVDRDGKAVSGNLKQPFDSRIYSYGHRNIQGLVLFSSPRGNGAMGLTAEHGPDEADEINWLMPGNFGWDPSSGAYDESVPMTDKTKFPDAVPAIWDSGSSTIAISGMAILTNARWQLWRGRVAVAVLKDQHVRLFDIKENGEVASEKKILKDFGRVRAVVEGPGGLLYLSTDNGGDVDKIIRVTPN